MKYYFRCPRCGNDEGFVKPHEQPSDLGCALLLVGGLIPALLYADHTRRRVLCPGCGTIFRQPPLPRSPLGRFACWIAGILIVLTVAALFCFISPDLAGLLPPVPGITALEAAVAAQPRVAAYLLVLLGGSIGISCWVAASMLPASFRKQLASEYRLEPPAGPLPPSQRIAAPAATATASPETVP